jgi:gamma-glutamyltranspeptidase/glutathione hydrolase
MDHPIAHETWEIRKPAVTSREGLVASQHYLASEIGAGVLAKGGNAIDAAVAAGLAIGTVEPWMSGLGGGGFMMIYLAKEKKVKAVQFGMVSPKGLDPADYPLTGNQAADLFGWPEVEDNRHIQGPYSIAVPGYVAGVAKALSEFGTMSWADVIEPACMRAEQGMLADWYASLKITTAASILAQFPASKDMYLPGGYPPVGEWGGEPPLLKLGNLAKTLRRLQASGPEDYYHGEVARMIAEDAEACGSSLRVEDLAAYEAVVSDADVWKYRDATVFGAPGLSAGPTLKHAQDLLSATELSGMPDEKAYSAYADALLAAYDFRLKNLGDSDESKSPSCTTHMTIVDKEGNIVALTQTLLSLFGSKVVLPQTGITMNNGIMWFDPRPGHVNSIAPGKKPLSNMCPTIVEKANGTRFGLGASGGRKIMPAVYQLISFMTDFDMDMETAFHAARIDVSGTETVLLDAALADDVKVAMAANFSTAVARNAAYPSMYACPNSVSIDANGDMVGSAYVASPWAKVESA